MDHTSHTDRDGRTQGHAPAIAQSGRLLGVGEVMARYGLRDRRTARRVMDAAGAFVVARRLYVRESDLVAHEDVLRAARRRSPRLTDLSRGHQAGRRPTPTPARPEPLPPGWWREDSP
jgi:hypothetical protein